MGTFKALSASQTTELDELFAVADSIIGTKSAVIKGNQKAATVVGTAIGGVAGAAIASGAGTFGVIGATAGLGGASLGAAGFIGAGITGVVALPIGIITLIGMGIGFLFGKNKQKKEQQKKANYVKEIVKKMEKILDKYENLKKEHERTNKEKDDIIRAQKEKLAEYEAIFEALKKKREDLESNLSFA